jgi:hypothetical protein
MFTDVKQEEQQPRLNGSTYVTLRALLVIKEALVKMVLLVQQVLKVQKVIQ